MGKGSTMVDVLRWVSYGFWFLSGLGALMFFHGLYTADIANAYVGGCAFSFGLLFGFIGWAMKDNAESKQTRPGR
jgi:hypothetical protein